MENKYYDIIDEYLEKLLQHDENSGLPRAIIDAMQYSVLGGGKRMRPTLLLSVCDMLGGNINTALPFAAAIELIHAYSLIHDDLPSMDNDDYRRGKPSCHKKFGEAIAILTGDALLNLAFETMLDELDNNESMGANVSLNAPTPSDAFMPHPFRPSISDRVRACRDIARASGYRGMVGGQALEFALEPSDINRDAVFAIHKLKTGALISAAVSAGARLAAADNKTIELMREFGKKFGLAFQIMDDIYDASPPSINLPSGFATSPTLYDAALLIPNDTNPPAPSVTSIQSSGDNVNFAVLDGRDNALLHCAKLREDISEILCSLNSEDGFLHKYINFILTGDA